MRRRTLLIILIPGCLAALLVCALAGWFTWSFLHVDPPGKGAKAELGYQTCAPIIAALARYREQNGAYPGQLAQLVPDFLPAAPGPFDHQELGYRLDGSSYRLEFHYTGPGMNTCAYTPETGWTCSGYY